MNIEKRNEVIEVLKEKYENIEIAFDIVLKKVGLHLKDFVQIGEGLTNIVYELHTREGKEVILKLGQ